MHSLWKDDGCLLHSRVQCYSIEDMRLELHSLLSPTRILISCLLYATAAILIISSMWHLDENAMLL